MIDLISRQAALDALDSIGSVDTYADREYAREVFERLPTIDPVKHGKWEVKPTLKENVWLCRCSACRHKFSLNGSNRTIELAYCPWCGAKMDRSEDEAN